MKHIKCMIVFIILIFIIGAPFTVSAIDKGLVTQPLSDKEISNISKQREFVKLTSYTPLTVKCFDVRDDHMVVIGADAGNNAIIAVYDNCGTFQYGFKTKEYGSFRVMWNGNNIIYYSIRSTFVFEINEDGKITNISKAENTKENSIFDRDVLLSATRNVDTCTYHMTNERSIADAFPGSYKKIIRTDAEDGTTVIYDASSNRCTRMVYGLVVIFILTSFIVSSCIVHMRRRSKGNTQEG